MSQYNDCMNAALVAQVSPGATPDMLYDYLVQNGAQGGGLNDLWHQVWDAAGIPLGSFNDRAYAWLATLGFLAPTLQQRWFDFWCAGGIIATETNYLLDSYMCEAAEGQAPTAWPKSIVGGDGTTNAILFRRQNGITWWYLYSAGVGSVKMAQSVALAAGEFVASFYVTSMLSPGISYTLGNITGPGVTVNIDFPKSTEIATPGWANCQFTLAAPNTITFDMQVESQVKEGAVMHRPQIANGTTFNLGEWTGTPCTGAEKELTVDVTGVPLKFQDGTYGYIAL